MSVQSDLYDSLLADIYVLTNRPDLTDETELALRSATLNAHHSDFYIRDLNTQLVQIPNSSYNTQLDISNLFPRYRAVDTVRLVDINGAVLTDEAYDVDVLEFGDIRDPDGKLKTNVAYAAGSSLNILTNIAVYGYLVGWYGSPSTKRTFFNSWIAQLYSPVIVYWAAAILCGTNGNDDKAVRYMKQINEVCLPFMQRNYLLGKAR